MKDLRKALFAVPALALLVFLVAGYLTRGAMQHLPNRQRVGGTNSDLVDQRPWQTIVALAPLAISAEEQGMAREAARLADHEVDQAFAMALRQATLQTRVLTGPALDLQKKVETFQQSVKDDQAQVAELTAAAQKATPTTDPNDDLDIAKAQLGLDTDELADATQDLARESGDQRAKIQQELAAHEAAIKKSGDKLTGGDGEIAVISAKRYATLYGRASAWFDQRSRAELIAQAEQEAAAEALKLGDEHNTMEAQRPPRGSMSGPMGKMTPSARVKMLESMAAHRSIMSILDDRIQTEHQLASLYARWQAQVWVQHHIVNHMLLESFALISFVVLVTVLAHWLGTRLIDRVSTDRRRAHTLRTIYTVTLQIVGFISILLIVFGPPNQISTILGLATAGLTVVFQDFIIAFCGWFVLMGKNGIRVGDWVEINAIGGEVIEISLFRTSLLETGNWTSRGHPTGRRVTFLNGFAIHGQYFNFSTAGQWMWDEITLSIPQTADASSTIEKIRALVAKETEKDTGLAEVEWKRVVQQNSLSQFSAQPTVDLRPAASGVDVIVRYVTRAEERYDLRNRLFHAMVGLLQEACLPAEVK